MYATLMAGMRCETIDEPRIARRTAGNVVPKGGLSPKRLRASLSSRSVRRKSIWQFAKPVKRSQPAAAPSERTSSIQSAFFGSHQRSDANIKNPTQKVTRNIPSGRRMRQLASGHGRQDAYS